MGLGLLFRNEPDVLTDGAAGLIQDENPKWGLKMMQVEFLGP